MKSIFVFLAFLFPLTLLSQQTPATPGAERAPAIVFLPAATQQFGFDALRYPQWTADYDHWEEGPGEDYTVPFKSIGAGQTDVVDAQFTGEGRFVTDSLVFTVSGSEQRISFVRKDRRTVMLTLPAATTNYTVSARYNNREVGRLHVMVYGQKREKVIIVPLIATRLDKDSLETRLNVLFAQANLHLDVEIHRQFTHEEIDAGALLDNPSAAFDRYTNQMRDLRDLYFDAHPNAEKNAFYIFIVPGFVEPTIRGYMVRNKTVAFVKANTGSKLVPVIARQLGRGIGLLKDSWLDNGPAFGTTDNLMDRTKGTHLRQLQWEQLRHSSHSYSLYDNYEDVRTNNGIVAYYFWKENPDGTLVLGKDSFFQAVKRPFKKNYLSYHLNIDNFLFRTLFTVKGRLVSLLHIVVALAVCAGTFWLGRKYSRYLLRRFKRPRWWRFLWRVVQVCFACYVSYLGFLLVNRGYGWYEVRAGWIRELQFQPVSGAVELIADNENYRHPVEEKLCSELLIKNGNSWNLRKQKAVLYFSLRQDKKGEWSQVRFQSDSDSLLLAKHDYRAPAQSHYIVLNYLEKDGSTAKQRVFNHLGVEITDKLKIPDPAKRILIFVNGYRPTSIGHTFEENFKDIQTKGLEFPDSKNLVYTFDRYDYWRPWQAINELFAKRVNPVETFYADGHFSVSTSNHRSLINFTATSTVYPKRCLNSRHHHCYSSTSLRAGFFGSKTVKTISTLPFSPNKSGFDKRRRNGRIAGRNIYQVLNELPNGSENDTLYIVAHSMGYAYALGIMDELRGKIHFGTLYVIAPENASSGRIDRSEWQEVWQYGSNFNAGSHDAPCLLDGVAPQARAGGLTEHNRVYIPKDLYRKKGFFDSHFIGYYTWLFDIPEGQAGYVKQR